jgi:hypothetical protein
MACPPMRARKRSTAGSYGAATGRGCKSGCENRMVTSQKSYPRAYVLRKSPTKSDRLEERTSHTFGGSIGRMAKHCDIAVCFLSLFVWGLTPQMLVHVSSYLFLRGNTTRICLSIF